MLFSSLIVLFSSETFLPHTLHIFFDFIACVLFVQGPTEFNYGCLHRHVWEALSWTMTNLSEVILLAKKKRKEKIILSLPLITANCQIPRGKVHDEMVTWPVLY